MVVATAPVFKCEMRISDDGAVCAIRFDTASFCCVINKCRTRTINRLGKCVHSVVVVVVFNITKFIPNKEHSQITLIFCIQLKKIDAESYQLLQEAYGDHVPS